MSRALSVKVATPKVIAALEAKLEKMKADKKNEAVNEQNYREAHKAWQKEVIAIALKSDLSDENCSVSTRSYGDHHNVSLSYELKKSTLPDEPMRDFNTFHDWQYKEATEEIQNALNILSMTEDDFVNASTMKSISKYL